MTAGARPGASAHGAVRRGVGLRVLLVALALIGCAEASAPSAEEQGEMVSIATGQQRLEQLVTEAMARVRPTTASSTMRT